MPSPRRRRRRSTAVNRCRRRDRLRGGGGARPRAPARALLLPPADGDSSSSATGRRCARSRVPPSAITELAEIPGLRSYLATHGVALEEDASFDEADAALRCFTARVFDGCDKSFLLTPERFEPAYRELLRERCRTAHRDRAARPAARRQHDGEGDRARRGDAARAARSGSDACRRTPAWVRDDRPSLVVAVDPGEGPDGLDQRARADASSCRARCGSTPAASRWRRSHGSTPARSQWRALPLGAGGRTDGKVALVAEQARGAAAVSSRRSRVASRPTARSAGRCARFELGCEREDRLDGLTDHLLALRALLEPEGPAAAGLRGASLRSARTGRTAPR